MSYDCENRLLSAGLLNASYSYDLLGRRLSLTIGPLTTQYVWDGAHIIAEYENGSLTKKYIYGPGMDNPVAMINVSGTSESWYYYYSDAQGSIRLITDSSGTPVESYTYDVYGRPYVMTSAVADGNWLTEDVPTSKRSVIGNPYMFTGRRWDSYTELYYYRFRDYVPKLGRFVQTDPLKYVDGMNMYAYCRNNPINWIDPWGLDTLGIHSVAGHSWTTYTVDDGPTVSYSLYPRGHALAKPENRYRQNADILVGVDSIGRTTASRWYELNDQQEERFKKWLDGGVNWYRHRYRDAFNNCSSWASNTIDYVVGEDVNADTWEIDSSGLPIMGNETPWELMNSIKKLEEMDSTAHLDPSMAGKKGISQGGPSSSSSSW